MEANKHIDKICAVAVIFALLVTIVFMNGEAVGIKAASKVMGYEERLFDTTKVHTIDIVMDDWDSFIATCQSEEYAECTVVIDGEAYKNVGIRGKGNTSLSTVSSMDSDRYSFKIEFDQYDSTKSYYGLDKLSLNNLIQDTTYMKDYLTYRMMGEFGVSAPLCSYVYITVNGEDWGLYLAVEGVEEAFLQRNYGSDYGELYKPDSLSFGGGRGNGRDFNMEDFLGSGESDAAGDDNSVGNMMPGNMQSGFDPSQMPEGGLTPGGGQMPEGDERETADGNQPESSGAPDIFNGELPDGVTLPEEFDLSQIVGEGGKGFGGGFNAGGDFSFGDKGDMFGGMGSSDVKLQYIDDDPDSYSNIFDNAKTEITAADQNRLIQSLKSLSAGEDIESVVNVEEVIRYFVVHNFVCNGDSYTGSMIHNYYLYEENGQLSMIPWDYNLAFGTFQSSDATDTVNSPIDTPVSGSMDDRPMVSWIFANEEYTDVYHQYFAEFLNTVDFAELIDTTAALIAPYVEKDPTKFYTYEEFETGVETIKEFCLLREASVEGQLDGTIPATDEGQNADSSALIDGSRINISDMGTMSMGGGMGGDVGGRGDSFGGRGDFPGLAGESSSGGTESGDSTENKDALSQFPDNMQLPEGMENFSGQFPGNMGSGTVGAQGGSTVILVIVSVVILAAGLVFAFKYKR